MGGKVKYNLSKKVPTQIDQGKNAATLSGTMISPTDPSVVGLNSANIDLALKQSLALEADAMRKQAYARLRMSASEQRTAFNNLGGVVQTEADGDDAFILNCGYGVRSSGQPIPPVDTAPTDLLTRVNGVLGQVLFSWKAPAGARNYEAQFTTDLSGATGWESAPEMPSKTKYSFLGLTSGTKYAFRVRAWGNGLPGPWSSPIQQMAP
jgi:hypothetical protein